ncbi:MAG: septum formation protein Maf [Oscillibacter sp.]|nr:septum formation protein Maf [Oscillibacter sp.]
MAKLVLASGSPRRRELLERIGLEFTVRVPEVEERLPEGLNPRETVEALSRLKAEAADLAPDEIGIAADTMVFLDGKRLGKPADEAEALSMLTALQGRRHIVCTGVTVRQGERLLTESEETAVWFRPAGQEELERYVRTGEPMDKAGAYGIQSRGALLAERIEGDYANVIGLPLLRLSRMLARFGVTVL